MPSTATTDAPPTHDGQRAPQPASCCNCDNDIVNGADLCDSCRRCADCFRTDRHHHHHGAYTAYGVWCCDDCIDSRYTCCSVCDEWNLEGEACNNGCDDDDGDLIQDYSYKPWPRFHGDGPLYLGPEIEVDTPSTHRDRCALTALERLGELGYLKEDSTISGFEIVTHPMSYAYAMASFPWSMLTELADAGAEASAACGLHLHLSRAGFNSPCHVFRWMKFIYRNQRAVIRLARRHSPEYAAFSDHERRAVKDAAKGARYGGRFVAINTSNADTLELRTFASSLAPPVVQAAFGFAAASVEYTRALSATDIIHHGGWTWPAFADWVNARPEYRPLTLEMEARGCAY